MACKVRLVSIVVVLAGCARAQGPDAVELTRHVEKALGWTGRFDRVTALQIEGTLDGAPIQVFAKQPSLFRMELMAGKDRIIQAYDGSFGWQMTAGDHAQAARLNGAQLDQVINQASNAIGGPLVQAPERGTRVEYEGKATVNGKDCYKLKLTLVSGAVIHSYIDAATFLESREELVSQDGGVIEETVGDYKTFDGILFPCRFVSKAKGGTTTYVLQLQKVTLNPSLAAGLFTMPRP